MEKTGFRVLVVDDEPELREMLCFEFEMNGYDTCSAANGHEAFRMVESERIDAVVTDIRMAGGDGFELLERIRKRHESLPPVILMTGFSDLSAIDAFHQGAEALVAKPFKLAALVTLVGRALLAKEKRWAATPEPSKFFSERQFASLEQSGDIHFGRGGFRAVIQNQPLKEGDIVGFRFAVGTGSLKLIEGQGIVRWLHFSTETRLPESYGIAISSLTEQCRPAFCEWLAGRNTRAFIPKD